MATNGLKYINKDGLIQFYKGLLKKFLSKTDASSTYLTKESYNTAIGASGDIVTKSKIKNGELSNFSEVVDLPPSCKSVSDALDALATNTSNEISQATKNMLTTSDKTTSVTQNSTQVVTSGAVYTATTAINNTLTNNYYNKNHIETYFAKKTDVSTAFAYKGNISGATESAFNTAFEELMSNSSTTEAGSIYNIGWAFTTTSKFLEGAGKHYPANTNIVRISSEASDIYWDVLAGSVDTSLFPDSPLTNDEIDNIISTTVAS